MADKYQCPVFLKRTDEAHAPLYKYSISHSQGLVYNQNFCINVGDDQKGNPDIHAGGVDLNRLFNELADIRERGNLVKACINLFFTQTQNSGIHIDVFTPGKLWVEA